MLHIEIPPAEYWDELRGEFVYTKSQKLALEHSLVAISKWESKWMKPFLGSDLTYEEILDYIRCMTITQNVNPLIYRYMPESAINRVVEYIEAPMTATTIRNMKKTAGVKEIVTSELIYYWMISWGIPMECQKWHLNRLITLIQIFVVKNSKPQKMSQRQIMSRNSALNAARRKKYHTRG